MKFIKYILFYLVLWLRPIFQLLSRIASPILIFFGFVLLAGSGQDHLSLWIPISMILLGFLLFILIDRYDRLLARLNPDPDIDLIL